MNIIDYKKMKRQVKMSKFLYTVKSILVLIIGIAMVIITLPVVLLALLVQGPGKYARPPRFGVAALQIMVKIFFFLCGIKTEVKGQENLPEDPAVYVGNHQGDFDALLILFALGEPKVTMAKKEVRVLPLVNLWMIMVRCIFVDRKNHEKALASMMESQDFVNNGRSVLYFAEGTRSKGPKMGPFKGGAFKTAVSTGTQIVPFAIDGTYRLFEAQGYLKPGKVTFSILPPVPVSRDENARELSDKVRDMIQKELEDIQK